MINNNFFLTKKKVQKEYVQKNDSNGKQSDPGNFLKSQFVIFQVSKIYKKGYMEMTKKFTLRL